MSVEVQQLNADSTFLLTFRPAEDESCTFTVLLDPWLSGGSSILHPSFQISHHTSVPAITSLADLEVEVDLILISQDKPDHCHRETLTSLPKSQPIKILATPGAVKKILAWRHFDPANIHAIPVFDSKNLDNTLHHITLPSSNQGKVTSELTIAHMPTKNDLTNLHNALGITYTTRACLSCPSTTITLLYTPHGISSSQLKPWITRNLNSRPLTVLFHALTEETNLPFLGGKVVTGAQGGIEIVRALGGVEYWISAHDEEKANAGLSVKWLKTTRWRIEDVQVKLIEHGLAGEVLALGNGGRVVLSSRTRTR